VSKQKYKVKFEKVGIDELNNMKEAVSMVMRLSRVDDQTIAVQFQRLHGTKIAYLKYFTLYKHYILNEFNDAYKNEESQAVKTRENTFIDEDSLRVEPQDMSPTFGGAEAFPDLVH